MKETRRTAKELEKLVNISKHLEYFMSNRDDWKDIKADIESLKEHILTLDSDRKVDHAKFAKTFKTLFFKENKELKEEVKELKDKIEDLENE